MRRLFVQLLRLYTYYSPLQLGKVPLIMLAAKTGLLKGLVFTSETKAGFKMELHIDDWVQQLIYFLGDYKYERAEALLWMKFSADSKFILDVGSNVGYFALMSARVSDSSAKIWAFEPAPVTFEKLKRNIYINGYQKKVQLMPIGVSDEPGEFELFLADDSNSGMTSLRKPDNFSGRSFTVKVVNGSSSLDDANVSFVDLMKIDVEGNEMKVLQGFRSHILKSKPVIFIEILDSNLRKFESSAAEVYSALRSWGYTAHMVTDSGELSAYTDDRDIGLGVFVCPGKN